MSARLRCLALGLAAWAALASGPAAAETVTGRLTAANGFAWGHGFDAELGADAVRVRVAVQLIGAGGVTALELDRVKPAWEAGIEGLWGGRFAVETAEGRRYPILVDADFRGPRFHHEVVVRPGRGRTDQLFWHLGDGPEVAAHEVGHMLGVYDEYPGGAVAPEGGVTDPASLMTSDPGPGATPRARHFGRVLAWVAAQTGQAGRVVDLGEAGGPEQVAVHAQAAGVRPSR
ncbi:MAG: hypothetical protein ACYDA8_17755 [Deferrisomatales bacterium]